MTEFLMIFKLLDLVHDYLLCPIFGDNNKNSQDYEKILQKLTEIESLIIEKRDGSNGQK